MSAPRDVVHRLLRQVTNLEDVEAQLHDAPDELMRGVVRTRRRRRPVSVGAGLESASEERLETAGGEHPPDSSNGAEDLETALDTHRRRVLRTGADAVRKVRKEGEGATLTRAERNATEAIILLVGRPALLIQEGKFFAPPDQWKKLDQTATRSAVEATCRSVGRVEVKGHPSLDWIGTAFLVAPTVIMTNRHVAQEFCRLKKGGWKFEASMKASIDYVEELGATTSLDFALQEIIGVHEDFDLSLFRVSARSKSGDKPPAPLPVASKPGGVKPEREVYVVGYPAWDGRRNDPDNMRQIFAGVYNVKRLQPGEVTRVISAKSLVNHDCSTLGGNSGSCVVDLDTHQVIGLHFGGKYLETNQAVALWRLAKDPLLKKAGVNFI